MNIESDYVPYNAEPTSLFATVDDRLAAMNLCLACLGRAGVSTPDTSNVDAKMASAEVDRVSYQVQHNGGAGWWFNRENNWTLKPDVNGDIYVPNNVLTAIASKVGTSPIRGITIRNKRLYDTVKHSYDLRKRLGTGSIEMDFVMNLPYEELPPSAKMFIAYRAAFNFSGQQEFDANKLAIVSKTMDEAKIDMDSEESSQQSNNYWEQNPFMSTVEVMVGPSTGRLYR